METTLPSPCPANGRTRREDMKELLDLICRRVPNARELMLSALRNTSQYALWSREPSAAPEQADLSLE